MVAFGFDKSSVSGGLTIIECCAQIVNALFIKDKLDMLFMQEDLKKLTEAIKNCISSLWTTYHEYHKQLGETGHGLIVLDHEHEIMLGSEIVNVYGTSPVANHIGVLNSSLSLDLLVLDREDEGFDKHRQVDMYAFPNSSPLGNSHIGTPKLDIDWLLTEEEATTLVSTVKSGSSPGIFGYESSQIA
ncbi:hypothetical protein J3A83DRAFT_4371528 [Scleroderma citrinum]